MSQKSFAISILQRMTWANVYTFAAAGAQVLMNDWQKLLFFLIHFPTTL
jgi:hypothetical protein